jgi:hypothetical protein
MEQNTKQKVKLIMVEEQPYIVNLEQPEVGDEVIVTVGGQYPSIVKLENQTVFDLVMNKRHTLTQAFRIFMKPNSIQFTPEQIEKVLENDGLMDCIFEDGLYKYSL